MKKLNKKAVAWKYVVAFLIALLGLIVLIFILRQSSTAIRDIFDKLASIF